MNAEFQWWLLILGIVIGGALVYLVLADLQGDRNEDETTDEAEADDRPVAHEVGADIDDQRRWSTPADPVPVAAAGPADVRGRASVGDDGNVQRDGAQGETPVADLP